METKLYKLSNGFAKHNNLLIYFSAIQLFETSKAVYLYGHGTTETTKLGVCCACGRVLTHPVSLELGIGPECGQHYHDWDLIGGYTKENIERLKGALVEIKFDSWVPKSQIEATYETVDVITVPQDHPILKRSEEMKVPVASDKPEKYAEVISGSAQYSLSVIKITFPFNFKDLDNVKTLSERRFIASGKHWVCQFNLENAEKLKSWGFTLSKTLENMIATRDSAYGGDKVITANTVKAIEIPGLKGELFEYQKIGVSFLEEKNGRALIADEMGLGKTVQALGWLQLHPEFRPAIIVVPASLKLNWQREAERWMTNPKVEIVTGTKPYHLRGNIIVINYDILAPWVVNLKSLQPQVLIMDEIHSIKNSTTKRTKAVKLLAKNIHHVIGLSGTPIVNRPIEAYNALTIINSAAIPNFKTFTQRYCAAKHNGFGWDFSGASNTDELHKLLIHAFMIRRKKSEVLKDLPDKLKAFVPMELSNQKEYSIAEADFISYLKSTKGLAAAERASNAQALAEIEGLKQLAVTGKMNQVIDWIDEFLETDQKLVVFAIHKSAIDILMAEFANVAVKIDGSVSLTARQEAVDKFQTDPSCRLFIGNIQAAGVGWTLTAASNTAIIELPWTPGALSQAEDRIHRIGQKESVTIHYLLAAGTIEEKIVHLLDKKQAILNAVLDGEKAQQQSILWDLINSYTS